MAEFLDPLKSLHTTLIDARRFGSDRAPHCLEWLTDNGSVYAAGKNVEIALALGLTPCITPVERPGSNGMAEAFVKTFKRD